MSHEDDVTPSWKTELSFERSAGEDGASPVGWHAPADETPADAAGPTEPTSGEAAAPALDHSWLTQPLEEMSEPVATPVVEPEAVPELEPAGEHETEREPEVVAPEVVTPEVSAPVIELPVPFADEPVDAPEFPAEPPAALSDFLAGEPDEPGDLDEPADLDDVAKVPFYKRDLSFKRTPREQKKPRQKKERVPKEERLDDVAAVPFYKRGVSLRRPKGAQPEQLDRPEPAAKAQTKRQRPKLKLPSLPKLQRGAGGGGGGGGKNAGKLVGLKIGSSQIAAARVTNGDTPQLLQAVSSPLEHGVVVGGELRDPEALANALREFFKRHNLPRRGIRLGIANNRIGVRTLDVVGIDDPKLLDNAVRFRAQEVLPIPLEDAVLDYHVISESVDADGQPSRRVLLVVAYRDLVDRYIDACRKADLEVVGIDLEAFALLRALSEPPSDLQPLPGVERGALVAVAIGHDRSTFAISDGRFCEFTRVLQWGGWSLNVAIARALDTSPSEAEPVKRALSFAGVEELPEGFNADQVATAREAARAQLQTFARELVSSLQFYQNQPGSLGIGEIVISGGTSHLPGFGAELERLAGVPVRVGDPLSRVTLGKGVGELDQVGSLAVAIGLGIDD